MDETLDTTPTHDEPAEQAVVGAVLLAGRRVLDDLADTGFDPGDCYAPKHEQILHAAHALAGRREPIDGVTVAAELGADLTRIGGPAYLHACMEACTSPASAPFHARIITAHATRRALAAAGRRVTALGHATDGGALTDVVDAAQAEVAAVAERLHGRTRPDEMGDALDDVLTRLEEGGAPATPTGFTDLDRLLVGGLQHGTLTTVAARPGAGKTVIGLQVALNVAATRGHVGFTSLEMTRTDLLLRGVSALAKVDYGRLQRSPGEPLSAAEWTAVRRATESVRDSGLNVSHRTTATVAAIRADIRHMIRTKGRCDLWVIDYLQLVSPADKRVIREQQVAQMTRALKQTALELGVPIVLLAQLNRDGEKAGRPPIITDLRESGSIEQDSDNVILLHRTDDHPDVLAVRVAKNRRGPQGDFALTFEGSYQRAVERPWTPHDAARGVA